MRDQSFDGGFGDEAPGDEVRQIVESTDGITTHGVAAVMGVPEDKAREVLEDLQASGEVERDADGEWFLPSNAAADDPYIF